MHRNSLSAMATHNHQIREVQRNLIEIDGPANL